jgi:endonuclease YncB( thermonuclease family)
MKKTTSIVLSTLITLVVILDVSYFSFNYSNETEERVMITRVIDGDTFVINDGRIIRLANINSPEKNFYKIDKSKDFLKQFENKTINLAVIKREKYGRYLSKAFLIDGTYLNLESVKGGFASKFLVEGSELKLFSDAEKVAIKKAVGIWNISPHFGCFNIKIDKISEVVHIQNICNKINMTNWVLKDESRKIYTFKLKNIEEIKLHSLKGVDNNTDLFWNSEQDIWNNDRDSLYLFDENRRLAAYEVYGY